MPYSKFFKKYLIFVSMLIETGNLKIAQWSPWSIFWLLLGRRLVLDPYLIKEGIELYESFYFVPFE